jgi:hypothetical protein
MNEGCDITANAYGDPGSNAGATGGALGLRGSLGVGGVGGEDGSGIPLEDRGTGDDGIDGIDGANDGVGGGSGLPGAPGIIPNYVNIPTVTVTDQPGTDDDDLSTAVSRKCHFGWRR